MVTTNIFIGQIEASFNVLKSIFFLSPKGLVLQKKCFKGAKRAVSLLLFMLLDSSAPAFEDESIINTGH